jgi:hypothetical protein
MDSHHKEIASGHCHLQSSKNTRTAKTTRISGCLPAVSTGAVVIGRHPHGSVVVRTLTLAVFGFIASSSFSLFAQSGTWTATGTLNFPLLSVGNNDAELYTP